MSKVLGKVLMTITCVAFVFSSTITSMPQAQFPGTPPGQPQSAPTQALAPAQPAAPAPTPAQIMPTQAAPSTPIAQAPIAPAAPTHEREIGQIETGLQKINALKQNTKQMLTEIDAHLNNAQQNIAQAKKISFDILHAGTQAEAQAQFNKVQQLLIDMQTLQTKVQTDFTKKFTNNLAEIKTQAAMIETVLTALQAQGAFTATQPIAMPPAAPKAPEQEKALGTKIFDGLTSATAYTIQWFKSAVNWVMEPPADDKKKSSNSTQSVEQHATSVINQQVPGQPAAQAVTPAIKNMLSAQISQLTKTAEIFERMALDFEQKFQEINALVNTLYTRLQTFEPLAKKIQAIQEAEHIQSLSGKQIVMHIVSKIIDLTIITATVVKDMIVKAYRYFFAPSVQKFEEDVSKKLEKMEKEKAAQKTEEIK